MSKNEGILMYLSQEDIHLKSQGWEEEGEI